MTYATRTNASSGVCCSSGVIAELPRAGFNTIVKLYALEVTKIRPITVVWLCKLIFKITDFET